MIELAPPREVALLVGAPPKSMSAQTAEEHLEELGRLADTAGAQLAGTLTQRLDSPHPKTYLGEGKTEQLRDLAREMGASLIVFDEELSPAQGKNLELITQVRVMDRAELILDIFATRAQTNEARMQVELAQLQYMLPRLTRMWAHLSRVRGGIGMRGPGETQLETDRRMIGTRIARLKEDLAKVARQRATQRKGRQGTLRASLVGYTNAGKSSVLRGLSGADVLVEDRLFATLDTTTRAVDVGESSEALVTDTVGFIRKLPHHLVASFRATLEEAREADLLLHVIDASHPTWEEQREVVEGVLRELGMSLLPTVLVFNKIDQMGAEELEALRQRAAVAYGHPTLFVSSVAPGGLEPLREALRAEVRRMRSEVELEIPSADGASLAEVYRDGDVLDREDAEDGMVRVRARLPAATLGRLRARGVLPRVRA